MQESQVKCFGGQLISCTHESTILKCKMQFKVYIPPKSKKVPVLFYLAGLTCTPNNGAEKGNFFESASKNGIALVFPDTSPRNLGIPGEDDDYDFGTGAGFYIDAKLEPFQQYQMETYISNELPKVIFNEFENLDESRISIMGHSMGGHGALTLFLKNPGAYKSVSAFAPIANPTKCPWGEKAFKGYLGDKQDWTKHDATELLGGYKGPTPEILIDCGLDDNFYKQGQLRVECFQKASKSSVFNNKVNLRLHEGYDHSYYFISTFAGSHVEHHARYLK